MPKADQPYSTPAHRSVSRPTEQSPQYAEFAAKLADANAAATALMSNVRAAARYLNRHHGYSLTVFASVTGLHKNSLIRLPDSAWMPKPETLRRLEKLVVRAEAKRRGETFRGESIKRGRPSKP
jgi:hypothetical protein